MLTAIIAAMVTAVPPTTCAMFGARSACAPIVRFHHDASDPDRTAGKPAADPVGPMQAADPPAGVEAKSPEKHFAWKEHPSFRFGKVLRIDFQAKLQEDVRRSYPGADIRAGLNAFELQRLRVGIEGRLLDHIDYEVERELTTNELTPSEVAADLPPPSAWKDVFVDVDYVQRAQVRAGRFKIPFGLDRLTGVAQNDFIYRSLGSDYLTPARDIGLMVHGRFFKRGLNYWTGVFNHDGDNARSRRIQGGGRTFAARVTGSPFRPLPSSALDALEVGMALTVSALSDDSFRPNGLRGRTVVTEDTFFDPVYVKGQRRRWAGEVDWPLGRASLRAEYIHVRDDRLNQGLSDENLPDTRHQSWYVGGTYLLTGEKKVRPVTPARNVLRGGIGAVELAARYERMWYDSVDARGTPFRNPRAETILPSGDRVLTLGVNWILNRWIKLQVNGIRERVEDPERSPVPSGAFWSQVVRFQFVL